MGPRDSPIPIDGGERSPRAEFTSSGLGVQAYEISNLFPSGKDGRGCGRPRI